jgi:D-glycero-alpha-D-manno-heptose-7-phosphate kinase
LIVVTRTPLRISFFGGGTDLPDFYEHDYGAVLSTAIDKYVYVTVKKHGELFDEAYRLNYFKTELVQDLEDIRNDISREALRLLQVEKPLYMSTIGDVPSGAGLGSSSAYAVGLINALCTLKSARVTPGELADMACHIEIDVLKKPIGRQDQSSAAFGGCNYIRFLPGGHTTITPVAFGRAKLEDLFAHFQLFWTGITRDADSVLREQRANIEKSFKDLLHMRNMADEAANMLRQGRMDAQTFGEMLDESWRRKRKLASNISNTAIDEIYERARRAGAYGGKLCGAGAGGFLLFCVAPERQEAVRSSLAELREVEFHYEPAGSVVLYPTTQHHRTFLLWRAAVDNTVAPAAVAVESPSAAPTAPAP